ncbi:MAG: hypothetical protein Ct9H300mP4_13040 [Gammaproteobacteria bacterium]|nr:MAG: hypothetical protein Ct9H300mP4_13040 [Gammaproteobacteria bacterium]
MTPVIPRAGPETNNVGPITTPLLMASFRATSEKLPAPTFLPVVNPANKVFLAFLTP